MWPTRHFQGPRTEGDDRSMGCRDSEGLGAVGGDGGGRWDFVRFDGDRLGVVNIMTLRDEPPLNSKSNGCMI